jgi:threonine/homoserine/homoserine lactone efflux protein
MVVFPTRLWEYTIAAFIIVLAPGPSVLFTIARGIAWGPKTAVATVAGNVMGAFSLSVVVALGLGPILQRSALAYTIVQIGGGLYLMYLGYGAIKESRISAGALAQEREKDISLKPGIRRSMRDGYWVGALNPKGVVFFAAILPTFVDKGKGHITSQLIVMGAIFAIIAFFSDGTWGLIAGIIRDWLAQELKRLQALRITGGTVMILLGLFTLIQGIRSHH